ncbi:Rv1355c family protein [Mycobacterium sp. SMC-18]|uniref:Rv1355c family protein n=1 Tax=Mycobacterium sp. SMC-18 TaxID=3381629 RepID=UPI003876C64E
MHQTDPDEYRPQILDPRDSADATVLDRLRSEPHVQTLDHHGTELDNLRRLRPEPAAALLDEPGRWVWYPWRRTLVSIPGPRGFKALRLDRNRNAVTVEEQSRLAELTVGVAGLSVGHVIAHTLALQGLCGRLRLADFDRVELSNLNRIPATVFDLGINKAVATARRIAELDPYLPVEVFHQGLTTDTVDDFLDGLNVLVEECDSLDIKAVVRVAAGHRRIPVLMATSDRGIVDVERFDDEPGRPILHGLLGPLDIGLLPGMSSKEKIPHILRHLEAEKLSPRTAASLIELDRTLATWPQVASEVIIGASAVAEAVRRIGLGEELRSGRTRIDVGSSLDQLAEPAMAAPRPTTPPQQPLTPAGVTGLIAIAAMRAPSGGNIQPWSIEAGEDEIAISLAPQYSPTIDVGFRGGAVAIGAAVFNARVAAAHHGVLGPVTFDEHPGGSPLQATLRFGAERSQDLANLYGPVLARETNRGKGTAAPLSDAVAGALTAVAEREGGHLRLIAAPDEIDSAAKILGTSDRIRFLTPHLHQEMIAELRWPGDPDPDAGIDVHSLGLDDGGLILLELLRRPEVMAQLADWNAGDALGDDMRDRVRASSALAVITVTGGTLRDYAAGGSAVEAVWVHAQQHGLAVQPVSPVWLFAQDTTDLTKLSARFADELGRLQREFIDLAGAGADERIALILRLTTAAPSAVTSRRSADRIRLPQ